MVEQEHLKSSTVFPETLISSRNTQNYVSNAWLASNATALTSPEESYNSDFLNIELLNGSVLSPEESFSSLSGTNMKKGNYSFQETLPTDAFATKDLPCDLYYDDKNMPFVTDYWHPMSERLSSPSDPYFEDISPVSFWGNGPFDLETLKMEDVFQVDKDDIVQSPTLAELNADTEESMFDSIDNFCMPLFLDDNLVQSPLLTPILNTNSAYKIPSSTETLQMKANSEVSSYQTTILPTDLSSKNGIIDAKCVINAKENALNSPSTNTATTCVDVKDFKPQVITKYIKQSYPLNESGIKTLEEKKLAKDSLLPVSFNQETFDSEDDDSEMDYDYSSDVDEESEEESKSHLPKQSSANKLLLQKKKSRYFWQYNIQSKGPKAPKRKLDGTSNKTDDLPGVLNPVFTSSFFIKGVNHVGKARRGDGNDLTPNPQKLYNIGLELEKLTSEIEGLVPANELPLNARSKSRKEKNKLASRACRLKKKAQHEANKLKLFGLYKEQKNLLNMVSEVKKLIGKGVDNVKQGKIPTIQSKIDFLRMKRRHTEVAGRSAEFVNNILKNVDVGDKTGGLDTRVHYE